MEKLMKLLFFIALLTLSSSVFATDMPTTRSLSGTGIAKDAVIINQVDASAFPKVSIFATVLKDGEPLKGLTAENFRVREDEVDQEPINVVPKLTPLSVVVALDTSGSMKKALPKAREAAKRFIDTLTAEDEALVLSFARSVTVASNFTKDKSQTKASIDTTVARGDTALFDALYRSVEVLKNKPGRKAVILLGDGVDDDGYGKQLSRKSIPDVLSLAKEVNVPIFTIGLGAEIDEDNLMGVADQTGAVYYNAPAADELQALYDGIGKQLFGQYNIYYTSNLPGDGSAHRIQLGHDEQVSIKEYISPAPAGQRKAVAAKTPSSKSIVAAAEAAPVPPSPEDPFGTPITGGKSFADAVQITPGTLYHIAVAELDESKQEALLDKDQFFWFDAKDGQLMQAFVSTLSESNIGYHQLFDAGRNPLVNGQTSSGEWQPNEISWMVPKDRGDRFYYAVKPKDSDLSFTVALTNFFDGESGTDAGNEEATAVDLVPGSTIGGYFHHFGDNEDWYVIDSKANTETEVRVRPSIKNGVDIHLYDQNGTYHGHVHSPNDGALTIAKVTPPEDGYLVVKIITYDGNGLYGFGAYNLSAGSGDVKSPRQPQMPKGAQFPSLRQ